MAKIVTRELQKKVLSFIRAHQLGVISTVGPGGQPEAAVMGISETPRLELIFGTYATSRKYQNLKRNPKVAFAIGWEGGVTIQYEGVAAELSGKAAEAAMRAHTKKLPSAKKYAALPFQRYFKVSPTWIRYLDLKTELAGGVAEMRFDTGGPGKELPFVPKPGQVDYTAARWAPVVNCVVMYQGRLLLVQRSPKMRLYPGYWNGISGFLDSQASLRGKVLEELSEELGLAKNRVKTVRLGQVFDQEAPEYRKTWIVHPVLVEVKTNKVTLDWEARRCRWVSLKEARKLKLLPGFDRVLDALFPKNGTSYGKR